MKPNEDIFFLIRSMTKKEKRHFQLLAQTHSKKNNYLLLFQEIDKLISYDEEKLKRLLRKKTSIKKFSVTKHLLYKMILKSLRSNYHNYSGATLHDLIKNVEILYNKGLYEQSLRALESLKVTAIKQENVTYLNKALMWESLLNSQINPQYKIDEILPERFSPNKLFSLWQEEISFMDLFRKTKWINHPFTYAGLPIDERRTTLSLLESRLLEDEYRPQSFLATNIYLELKSLKLFLQGKHNNAAELLYLLCNNWKSQPDKMELHCHHFLEVCINTAICCLFCKKTSWFDTILAYIRSFPINFLAEKIQNEQIVQHLENLHLFYTSGENFPGDRWSFIFNPNSQVTVQWKILYAYYSIFFLIRNRQFSKAHQCMIHFAEVFDAQTAPIHPIYWKLLELIIYHELEYTDLLEYKLRSFCRLIKNEGLDRHAFGQIADTLKKSLFTEQRQLKNNLFLELKGKYEDWCKRNTHQNSPFLSRWINKKCSLNEYQL